MIDSKLYVQRLASLVSLPSVSSTSTDLDMSNEAVIDQLANWLNDFGFSCVKQTVDENLGKYNLVATLGQGSGGLVLSGHTDTVPCNPERWQQDPFQLTDKDDRLFGLGATDMKGFFPVVLEALEQLKEQLPDFSHKLNQPIIILATADEESSMSGARELAQNSTVEARYAVIGEPTNLTPIRMHKGIMMEKIRVTGKAGHSSNPGLGKNALEVMHSVIEELMTFRRQLQQRYQNSLFEIDIPTLNLGCIHGGDNPNRICGHCEMLFDLRPLPGMPIDELHLQIEQRLKPLSELWQVPIELEKLFGGVEAFEQSSDSPLVTLAEQLTSTSADAVAFATEAPFLKSMGMDTIVLGPGSIDQAHQPNEFIDTKQIEPAVNIIKELIQKLCLSSSD